MSERRGSRSGRLQAPLDSACSPDIVRLSRRKHGREGTESVEYRGFRVIEIWELQNDLAAGWPFVPFVHMSGLHAAEMHKIPLPREIWPRKVRRRFTARRYRAPSPDSLG